MKTYLQLLRLPVAILALVLLTSSTRAADRYAVANGNWSATATWSATSGGAAGATVPVAGDNVFIGGFTVTVTGTAACSAVTFTGTSGTLTVNSGITLTVSGTITLQNSNSGNRAATISGAGTISCANIQVGGVVTPPSSDRTINLTSSVAIMNISGNLSVISLDNGNSQHNATFTQQSGVVTVSGQVVLNAANDNSGGSSTARVNLNGGGAETGTLSVVSSTPISSVGTGTHTLSADGTSATVDYAGTAQTVFSTTYTNLTLSGSGAKTLSGFTVNGKLSIQGTATATGTSPTYGGSASLEYKGSAAQNTSNVEFPTSVNVDLIIDNASGVTLNSTKTLSGSLTLTSGVLYTGSGAYLRLPDGFKTVNGGSASSYVDGPIHKRGNDGGGFTFPVGRNGVYAPMTITSMDNNADELSCEYFRASAAALGPINASQSGQIDHLSNCEYWELNEINDAGGATSVNVTAVWSTGSGCGTGAYVNNPSTITLAHFNTGNNTWDNHGGVGTGNNNAGSVTWYNVSTFSPFALASTSLNNNPLPVKFSDVKAFEKGTANQIDWTNETEENLLHYYVVERSANGVDFSAVVATVAPRSNNSDQQTYTVFDASPLDVSFYRVKAVELTGKTIYSKLVKVSKGAGPKGIILYPNPVKGNEVTVGFSAAKGQYRMQVINAAGQAVYSRTVAHPGGTVSQTVTLPSTVKPGVYSLLISGDNYRETKMFVVQQ